MRISIYKFNMVSSIRCLIAFKEIRRCPSVRRRGGCEASYIVPGGVYKIEVILSGFLEGPFLQAVACWEHALHNAVDGCDAAELIQALEIQGFGQGPETSRPTSVTAWTARLLASAAGKVPALLARQLVAMCLKSAPAIWLRAAFSPYTKCTSLIPGNFTGPVPVATHLGV